MANSNESNFSKGFIIGAFVGGLAGAVTALLLAPKSGTELRKDLVDSSSDFYFKAQDYFNKAEEQVSDMVNEGKSKAQVIIDTAKNKAEGLLHDAENVLKDARDRASSSKDQVQHRIDNVKDALKAGTDAFKYELKHNVK